MTNKFVVGDIIKLEANNEAFRFETEDDELLRREKTLTVVPNKRYIGDDSYNFKELPDKGWTKEWVENNYVLYRINNWKQKIGGK